jgi:D-alanine-D-alanine ligase-like ATP-grasp enzyme
LILMQIRRAKNLWVSLKDNFCTPCAVWELDLEFLEKLIDIEIRKQITRCLLNLKDLDPEVSFKVKDLLTLIAAKLQSRDSDEVFAWLMDVNSRHSNLGFCYSFLDEKVATKVGPLTVHCLLKINTILVNSKKTDVRSEEAINLIYLYSQQVDAINPSLNTLRLLIKATGRLIPIKRHSDRISYQLGIGSQRKLIHNGYTNHTSQLATNIATHKFLASSVMRQASLPVPNHIIVKSFEEAKAAVARIKFPLVVKPTSTDKGTAVTVGILNEDELYSAWIQASQFGNVLIEEMLSGFDHRFHVVNGKCIYVMKRMPPSILGNGVDSIERLIPIYRAERAKNRFCSMHPYASLADTNVIEFLNKQGLSPTTVIKKDQRVFLRSNSNVSTGGVFEDVTNLVHPANILLAERAARIVGLDHAGIDYITTDISMPWTESDGGICEVNPTPGVIHDDGFLEILNYLFPENLTGRIPLILIIGDAEILQNFINIVIEFQKKYYSTYGYIYDHKLNISSPNGAFMVRGKRTQDLLISLLSDEFVKSAFIQLSFEELKAGGVDLHYIDLLLAMGTESEISLIQQTDLIYRCNKDTILINPTIGRFQEEISKLFLINPCYE